MDQIALVTEQIESGQRLMDELAAGGYDVEAAFWAKPTDEGKWFMYLAMPLVDDQGPGVAYRLVLGVLRKMPSMWIEPLEIRVIGISDSLAEAVLTMIKPKSTGSQFAVPSPKPFRGATRLGASTFGGVDMDEAYIYPVPAAVSS